MRNLIPQINHWQNEGKTVALATVVKAYGSSPRPLGSKMAVSDAGEMAGSVSGGCVESAVLQEALAVIESGQPKLLAYGIADDWAQGVGLACGGSIEVFVERINDNRPSDTLSKDHHPASATNPLLNLVGLGASDEVTDIASAGDKEMLSGWGAPILQGKELFGLLIAALESNQLVALATVVGGGNAGAKLLVWPDGRVQGELGWASLNQSVLDSALELLSDQKTARRSFEIEGEACDVFIEVFPPPPRLIVVGAVHIAIPLVKFAKEMGFHTTVVDARSAFATPDRFAHADQLILQWPDDALAELALDEGCYVAILSHDDKLDVPALKVALNSRSRYIGALGSHKTMAGRVQKLREMGVSDEQLARIHNPIGLNLGGRRPEEIALAIMAEIVAVRNGSTSNSLADK